MKKMVRSFRLSEKIIEQIENRDKNLYKSGSDYLEAALEHFEKTTNDSPVVLLSEICRQLDKANETFAKLEELYGSEEETGKWKGTIEEESFMGL